MHKSSSSNAWQCLVNGMMTEFPGRRENVKTRTKGLEIIPVDFEFRQHENSEMAGCDQCHEWFHKQHSRYSVHG